MKREPGENPGQTPLLYALYMSFEYHQPLFLKEWEGIRRWGKPEDLPISIVYKLSGNKSLQQTLIPFEISGPAESVTIQLYSFLCVYSFYSR